MTPDLGAVMDKCESVEGMITTALGHGNGVHWPRFRDFGHGEMDTTLRNSAWR